MTKLGKYSYGLYVFHGIVAYALKTHSPEAFLTRVVQVHSIAAILQIGIGVSVSLLLAVCSYEFYERRFLALKRHFEDEGNVPSVVVSAVSSTERE